MDRKSFCLRFINILPFFVFCLLLMSSANAQEIDETTTLWGKFKEAKNLPCGQRDEAIKIGKELIKKYGDDDQNKDVVDFVRKQIPIIEVEEEQCKNENSLSSLFEKYKTAKKSRCGERSEAVALGNRIINLYADDADNQAVIQFIRQDIPKIEEADRICQRNARYDNSYKIKDWGGFFAVSREVIAEEGDTGLALDVMLTLVSVGFDLTAYDKINAYNGDTVFYAKKAIELIEAGVRTKSRWGTFKPFETKSKALGWLNYTIGYISYFRLKENKKAIPYFYRATQYDMEFKYDAFIYQAVAIYYFDKEAVTASSLTINEFITKANAAADNPFNDGFGYTARETAKQNEIAALFKNLVNLYNMRYNLAPDENVNDLADYIQKIINRPLIDPSAKNYRKKTTQIQTGTQ